MLKKFTSVLVLALTLGGQHFLVSSAYAQETAAPAAEAAPVEEAAADPSAAPAEAAAPAADATSVIDNADAQTQDQQHFGLKELWSPADGRVDWVNRVVLILLVIMSASTWYISVVKVLSQAAFLKQGKEAARVWEARSLQDGVNSLSANSAFRGVAEEGLKAVKHHDGKLTDKIDLESWVSMSIHRAVTAISNELATGMAVLATVASASPFVGLFGTVWGILNALITIAKTGQASIDKVAGPVGEALIMTAIGLAVAVPAVFLYNWLIRRNKLVSESLNNFAADVHAYLVVGVNNKGK